MQLIAPHIPYKLMIKLLYIQYILNYFYSLSIVQSLKATEDFYI